MNKDCSINKAAAKSYYRLITPAAIILLAALPTAESAAHGNTPPSLQGVSVPPTPGLLDGPAPVVINKAAAIQLGKALFWDVNVGSDGMACASCHFHAGADGRYKNQLSPGKPAMGAASTRTFEDMASGGSGGPNYTLKKSDFPLYQLSNPADKASAVMFNTDDVVSSAGVFSARFLGQGQNGDNLDQCGAIADGIFHQGALNTRQVQVRQAPSVINAAFNFRNFWDGRANNIFNGVSPFGPRDVNAGVWVKGKDGKVSKQTLSLENASLASQAVAPPVNTMEMSCRQRGLSDIGRKLLNRKPLASQKVHTQDSVLAELRDASGRGLNITYKNLVKAAFAPRFWSGSGDFGKPAAAGAAPYSQMEANFSLFFGLAIQLYEQTLISDQTPFDSPRQAYGYPQMPKAMNAQQRRGLVVFLNGHCVECHKGPTLSAAAHPLVVTPLANFPTLRLVNRRTLNGSFTGSGVAQGIMDDGYFNTSVTKTSADLGVGGKDPFGNPLSFSKQYLDELLTGKPMVDPIAINSCDLDNPFAVDFTETEVINDPYTTGDCGDRSVYAKVPTVAVLEQELAKRNSGRALVAVNGAFKVPSLRNVELTAPYMHNGSMLTLEQVVDFYFRGGNFNNKHHFATVVFPREISAGDKADLVAFLKSLTDERVRWERAPFDHPELLVPHGHASNADTKQPKQARDLFLTVPAVGKNGRTAALGPIKAFQQYLQP